MFHFNLNLKSKSDAPKISGKGYVILNVIRALNIVALLTAGAGSMIMLVRTVQTSNFFFFDGVSHFITFSISMFLIVSELSVLKSYFDKYWPLLSEKSGFLFLGSSMLVLGFNILGNLNKNATSVENLGLPLWRVVIAGGILNSIFGFVNIIASFCFGSRKSGITSRMIRAQGSTAVAPEPQDMYAKSLGSTLGSTLGSVRSDLSRRPPSLELPSYHAQTEDRRRSRFGLKFPIRTSLISKPTTDNHQQFSKFEESRASPVIPEVQRPPTALHPAYSPSRYSVASRF